MNPRHHSKEKRRPWPWVLCSLLLALAWLQVGRHALLPPATASNRVLQPSHLSSLASSDADAQPATSSSSNTATGCGQAAAAALLADCAGGLPSYCPRRRPQQVQQLQRTQVLTSAGPADPDMAQQKNVVDQFVAGQGLKERVMQLQQLPDKRGIVISAGKPHHDGNAAIILHALRKQYNCTLPVEIAYRGDKEFDPVTRATLAKDFQPLFWLDLEKQAYPSHHHQGYSMDRYEPKIYALYHSRFQQVLLLDADNLPTKDPSYLFESPHMSSHGLMMWLDLWSPHHSSTTFIGQASVWPLLGIDRDAYLDVLTAGQGFMHRVAESGQLLFDRVRHADVLEYLWYLTSFSTVLYKHVLGDKDTFGFAAAMAGKLHELYAVAIPPAAAFSDEGNYWQFHAMLQYDHLGQPAFFHRTFYKWNNVTHPPPQIDAISGPLPNRFIISYLGNRTVALSPKIPRHAMRPVHINSLQVPAARYVVGASHTSPPHTQHTQGSSYASAVTVGVLADGCPLTVYLEYGQARDLGLPVARQPQLEAACTAVSATDQLQQLGLLHTSSGQQQQQQRQHTKQAMRGVGGLALSDPSSNAGTASCADSSSLWPSLDAATWLAACHAQRGSTSSGQGTVTTASSSIKGRHHHKSPAERAAGGVATGAMSSNAQLPLGLPDCEAVDWHVARNVLHEYAEAVATDSQHGGGDSNVIPDPDPQQPLLAVGSGDDVGWSVMHQVQYVTNPAARAWVMQHLHELPALLAQS